MQLQKIRLPFELESIEYELENFNVVARNQNKPIQEIGRQKWLKNSCARIRRIVEMTKEEE